MNNQPDTTTTEGKIEVMQAFAAGKRVQFEDRDSQWQNLSIPGWDWQSWNYRIHPDDLNPPKLRPWRPEEVPVGALIRSGRLPNGRAIITYVDGNQIVDSTPNGIGRNQYSTGLALRKFEHSIDGGKTWLPCGVRE